MLEINDTYRLLHAVEGGGKHELSVIDLRVFDQDFSKDRRGGVILDGLTFDSLSQIHSWLGEIIRAHRATLPGV